MEADWEFEVGGDAPVIEAQWPGFADLRSSPERAWQLPEAAQLPALAEALARLNELASPVWTSKCDLWPRLEADAFDPDELDAPPGCAAHAMGCYIDLLPRSDQQWPQPAMAAAACKHVCSLLRAVPLRCCRADLVIRRAFITPELEGLGITAYLTSSGESKDEATVALRAALAAFVDAVCGHSTLE
ncbi:MAG: hypothetical protein ABSC47_06045 [Terracidiphilus sp.]|jgi:hypothetical protein